MPEVSISTSKISRTSITADFEITRSNYVLDWNEEGFKWSNYYNVFLIDEQLYNDRDKTNPDDQSYVIDELYFSDELKNMEFEVIDMGETAVYEKPEVAEGEEEPVEVPTNLTKCKFQYQFRQLNPGRSYRIIVRFLYSKDGKTKIIYNKNSNTYVSVSTLD